MMHAKKAENQIAKEIEEIKDPEETISGNAAAFPGRKNTRQICGVRPLSVGSGYHVRFDIEHRHFIYLLWTSEMK